MMGKIASLIRPALRDCRDIPPTMRRIAELNAAQDRALPGLRHAAENACTARQRW